MDDVAAENHRWKVIADSLIQVAQEIEALKCAACAPVGTKEPRGVLTEDERKALFCHTYPSWTSRSHAENEGDRRLVASIEAAVLRKVAKMSMGYRKDNYQNPMVSFRRDLICLAGDFPSCPTQPT